MTSPSGELPPNRSDDESDDLLKPPLRPRRNRDTHANFWDEEEAASVDAGATATRPGDAWSRPRSRERFTGTDRGDFGDSPEAAVIEDDVDFMGDGAPPAPSSTRVRRVAWELVQTLLLAALIFLMVRGVAQNFRVEGPSMEPGLHNGQYLLVNKAVYFKLDLDNLSKYIPFISGGDEPSRFLFHGPKRGDVVVFRYPQDPSRDFIKRIIGLPGDTVEIVNSRVVVNGVPLDEPYINGGSTPDMPAKIVPEASYFVMGDNRPNSSDSRNWGFVPEENIIGKAMFSYWPLSDFGGVGNTSIDLGVIKIPAIW